MRWIVLTAALGLTACTAPVEQSGLCAGLRRPVGVLRAALDRHTDTTPDDLGEAATDVVLGAEAGCRWKP